MSDYKTERYFAVVETGSCSMDGQRWEERATCGHAHKTREAAEKCLAKNRGYNPRTRTCSALWYNGRIHNQHGERA